MKWHLSGHLGNSLQQQGGHADLTSAGRPEKGTSKVGGLKGRTMRELLAGKECCGAGGRSEKHKCGRGKLPPPTEKKKIGGETTCVHGGTGGGGYIQSGDEVLPVCVALHAWCG